MEETLEDMIIRIRGNSRFNTKLATDIQTRIDNHVRSAVEDSNVGIKT